METFNVLLTYLEIINVLSFILMGADKFFAKRDMRRIPEATLMGVAVIGGSIGAIAGMYCFRHKTRKPRFYVGLPVILAIQVLFILGIIWAAGL